MGFERYAGHLRAIGGTNRREVDKLENLTNTPVRVPAGTAEDADLLGTEGITQGSGISGFSVPPRKRFWKRILDLTTVIITSPLWLAGILVGAVWIKIVSKGAVFYRQERIGLAGEKFVIFKFRSMGEGAGTSVHEDHLKQLIQSNQPMRKLDGADSRLILGGKLLRATGLDELPQVFNVILGNMSIVGPRPCTPSELEKYGRPFMRRFRGLPGITGSWQVNGKNETTFRRMIALDVHYLRNISVRQDLWIMVRTGPTLFKQIYELYKKKLRRQPVQKMSTSSTAEPQRRLAPSATFSQIQSRQRPLSPATNSLLENARQAMSDSQRLIETPSGDTQRINLPPPAA
jgi:lipopolysaccharide/colanic/teichoic acid biosynthesis glycosyltransferase